MTVTADKLLDDAFEVYVKIASQPDSSPISWQTPSWEPNTTPYDHAAQLVRSLLPYVYNYDKKRTDVTENIWVNMVECLQVLSMEQAQEFINECNVCGNSVRSYGHYTECQA